MKTLPSFRVTPNLDGGVRVDEERRSGREERSWGRADLEEMKKQRRWKFRQLNDFYGRLRFSLFVARFPPLLSSTQCFAM